MKKIELDAQSLCARYGIEDIGQGLSLYLKNLNRGRQMTDPSWLYESKDKQAVLDNWIEIMKSANNMTEFGEEFNNFDLKQVEKFGPQGGVPPIDSSECWDVVEPLYASSEYDNPTQLSEWFQLADEFGKQVFGGLRLRQRPLAPESVVKDMRRRDTLTTNSGFPRFTKRFRTWEQEVADAKSPLALHYPAIILFRYYHGKLRPVWMFPMSTNLVEAGFQIPIQKALAQSPLEWVRQYCTPWLGFEYVKGVLTQQWLPGLQMVGGDTTKMDAHMRPAQIALVFEIVKWLFQKQYWEDLYNSLMHITDIDLIWSLNESTGKVSVIEGVHGLASGSSWTQLSETVLQMFMAYVKGCPGQGIGDDFVWQTDIDAETIVDYLAKFGLPANPAKQSVSEDNLTFLQRYFRQGFFSREADKVLGAYYPTIRALGSMLYPEKFHDPEDWNSDMFCTRCFTIMENCVDDPCFEEFVQYVTHGQKDLIPFAKKSSRELDTIQRRARQVSGLFPNYNQEKQKKPLSEFSSILYAKQL